MDRAVKEGFKVERYAYIDTIVGQEVIRCRFRLQTGQIECCVLDVNRNSGRCKTSIDLSIISVNVYQYGIHSQSGS